MKITPGFWRQRDGDRAEVVGRSKDSRHSNYPNVGYCSEGVPCAWTDNGALYIGTESIDDLVAPWEEPKLRPWTRDEFPHWCAIRRKQGDQNDPWKDSIQFATTLVPEGCYIARSSAPYTWQYLLESYEHSTDGGKTWHPCGVMEGGAK